jgi:hypothetical protein
MMKKLETIYENLNLDLKVEWRAKIEDEEWIFEVWRLNEAWEIKDDLWLNRECDRRFPWVWYKPHALLIETAADHTKTAEDGLSLFAC